ncbi:MAG: chondroitinase-B domain-containing protein [Kiritimatiellia bacterium]
MKKIILSLPVFLVMIELNAMEYFVNKQGSDANEGTSREKAFATIQKGVDALQTGDTLTVGPGEYFESARRKNLGSEEKDTIIRAEIRGTALMRGDMPAPQFRKVEGYRFVYAADFGRPAQAVNEVDTLMTMAKNTNFSGLEYQPGEFSYDAEAKKLYISTTDLLPPEKHFYTVSVIKSNGLWLEDPARVIVDGLAFTGFNTDTASGWGADSTKSGLFMEKPVRCVVRHCVAYLNSAGLMLTMEGAGRSNVIENCVAYGNYSPLNGEGCNIQVLGPNQDTIRNCYGYWGRDHNISIYGRVKDAAQTGWIKNCLAWGAWLDLQQKGGFCGITENSIGFNRVRTRLMTNCLFGVKQDCPAPDSIDLKANWAQRGNEFADPENLDFRLQGSSQFRGKGPKGCDLGAFPYLTNIYYVSTSGSNGADGLSVSAAWKTIEHALKNARSGDTLYLEPGSYVCSSLKGLKDISIRGRGTGAARIEGAVEITGCGGIGLERLNFTGAVKVNKSRDMRLKNCTFEGFESAGVASLLAEHCVFVKELELGDCEGVFLAGNIYAAGIKAGKSGIEYSDYNAYADKAAMRGMPDKHSRIIRPEIEIHAGAPSLKNADAFGGRGPNGTALGVYNEYRRRPYPVAGPFVASVSATTANLEWWTSQEGITEIAWGDTPECLNTRRMNTGCYNAFSLTGLKPGSEYYFRIKSINPKPDTSFAQVMEGVETGDKPVSIKTAAKDAEPKIYYVAPDGKAENTGLSRKEALPTIGAAAGKVKAGDTVLIAGGTYREIVQVRATGAEGRPITFKSLPGERVILDGNNRALTHAIRISGKHYVNFDGLYFTGHGYGWAIQMNDCRHVSFSRCMFRQEGGIDATACADLLVKNCVLRGAMEGLHLRSCSNIRYENNVSFVHLIMHANIANLPSEKVYFTKNILTDNQLYKLPVCSYEIARFDSLVDSNNCYFLRVPDALRKPFLFCNHEQGANYGPDYAVLEPPAIHGRISLMDYYAAMGYDGNVLLCDPQFKGLAKIKIPPYKNAAKKWEGLTIDPLFLEAVADGKPGFPPDCMPPDADFDSFFATDPEVVKRGLGLQPEAFKDFGF